MYKVSVSKQQEKAAHNAKITAELLEEQKRKAKNRKKKENQKQKNKLLS